MKQTTRLWLAIIAIIIAFTILGSCSPHKKGCLGRGYEPRVNHRKAY